MKNLVVKVMLFPPFNVTFAWIASMAQYNPEAGNNNNNNSNNSNKNNNYD